MVTVTIIIKNAQNKYKYSLNLKMVSYFSKDSNRQLNTFYFSNLVTVLSGDRHRIAVSGVFLLLDLHSVFCSLAYCSRITSSKSIKLLISRLL